MEGGLRINENREVGNGVVVTCEVVNRVVVNGVDENGVVVNCEVVNREDRK
jgi:hypothetical protein